MQGRILVVEDDTAIRQLMTAVLESAGHTVFEVTDGPSAHPTARDVRPDLVLCDVGLPGIDGFEVLGLLKDDPDFKHVPVIMVTAWAEPAMVAKALDRGAHDYVRKPFDISELIARVEAGLRVKAETDFLMGSAGGSAAASSDPVSALPNRRFLEEALERQTMAARRTGRLFSVVLIDVDRFAQVNADLGCEAGDDVLLAAAKRLRLRVRASDILGRWGGDQLMAIAPGTGLGGAGVLAEDMRTALADRPLDTPGAAVRITASFGVAELDVHGHPGDVVARAEAALAEAKTEGRNSVRLDQRTRGSIRVARSASRFPTTT